MPLTPNFVVEDGSGKTNSNAYCDDVYCDQYFLDRGVPGDSTQTYDAGVTVWDSSLSATIKRQAIVRATDYIEYFYRYQFKGAKVMKANALSWPRVGATIDEATGLATIYAPGLGTTLNSFLIDSNEIPFQLMRATAELASRSLTIGQYRYAGDLATDLDPNVNYIKEQCIGPIRQVFRADKPVAMVYRQVELYMAPLLESGGGMIRLARG